MAQVYHQIRNSKVNDVCKHGLVQIADGERHNGDTEKADACLNSLRPELYTQYGLDRKKNVYCYLSDGEHVVDITSGMHKKPEEVIDDLSSVLLQLEVDPSKCFVGDLDLYDRIMQCLRSGQNNQASILGRQYWAVVQSLQNYSNTFSRPEVMVTYDIPSSAIIQIFEKAS